MRSLGNVLIRAWLLTPKKPGKYPALLTVQGYSTNMQSDWTFDDDNVVSLGLNIRGHGNSRDDVNPGLSILPLTIILGLRKNISFTQIQGMGYRLSSMI